MLASQVTQCVVDHLYRYTTRTTLTIKSGDLAYIHINGFVASRLGWLSSDLSALAGFMSAVEATHGEPSVFAQITDGYVVVTVNYDKHPWEDGDNDQ